MIKAMNNTPPDNLSIAAEDDTPNKIIAALYTNREVSFTDIAEKLNIPFEEVKRYMQICVRKLEDTSLFISQTDQTARLLTRPEYAPTVKLFRQPEIFTLSEGDLQTIIAITLNHPATKKEIDDTRQTDSGKNIRFLIDIGLVRDFGKLDRQGSPIQYGLTDNCLHRFQVRNVNELYTLVVNQLDKLKKEMGIPLQAITAEEKTWDS